MQARAWLALSDVETEREAAAGAVDRVLKLCRGSGLVHLEVLALARQAELLLSEGRLDVADRVSQQAVEMLRHHGNVQGSEERVLMARASVLEALDRRDAARALIDEVAGIIRTKAGRIEDPVLRGRFLELPPNPEVLAAAGGVRTEGAS